MNSTKNKLLNTQELSLVLNIPQKTIYNWTRSGILRFFPVGKHKRYLLEITLQDLADNHFKRTGERISPEIFIRSLMTTSSLTTEEEQEDENTKNEANYPRNQSR